MSSSEQHKRLSTIIREDEARSGVENLVGVVETGPVMRARVQELRGEVERKGLPFPEVKHGQSLREEIRQLEGVLAEHASLVRAEVEKKTLPLLTMHTSFAFVTRMWGFAIVLLLAELTNNSIFVVSLSQFISSLGIFVFSPYVGAWLDRSNRLDAMKSLLFWNASSISFAYALCIWLLGNVDHTISSEIISDFVYVIAVSAAVAHLTFTTTKMSLEKDWIVCISSGHNEWLSSVNSRMTQIDLMCQLLAPTLTGLLFFKMSYFSVTCVLFFSNAIGCCFYFIFLSKLFSQCPSLGIKLNVSSEESSTAEKKRSCSWALYNSGCAGTLASYSFLFLTVLSFGSVMIVYLKWSGFPEHYIGMAKGLSSLFGFTGASVFPSLKYKFGLINTGVFALWFQVTFVCIAGISVVYCSAKIGGIIMIVSVLISRFGLWLFDLCARQISQETIEHSVRGEVNGQWQSMTSFFSFSSYALACYFSDPAQFWILTTVSSAMVVTAASTFTISNLRSPFGSKNRNNYEAI